jgi:mono/diheme cytochrome c family protein
MSRSLVVAVGCASVAILLTAFSFPLQIDAEKEFAGKCAICHGDKGAGDGPAGAAFDPKPPDFTDAEYQEGRTDEELTASIADGTGAMPAFKGQLSDDAIAAVVAYIRELGSAGGR